MCHEDFGHPISRVLDHIPVLCNIHDVELACAFCTKVIGLQDGVKKFEGPPDKLDKRALEEIYAMEVL